MNDEVWYAARCVFRYDALSDEEPGPVFEERVTLHRAGSFEEAFEKAESAAREYEKEGGPEFVDCTDVYHLFDEPADGAEVFSLLRIADMEPGEYLRRFFQTGGEVASIRTQTGRAA